MMRYMGLCAVLSIFLAGCSESENVRISGHERSIGFTTDVTRTAKEDFEAGDAFAVWGWYVPEDASSQVFDATKVSTADGISWSYENLRFWQADKTYAFHALYPSVDMLPGTADCTADGILSVSGFNVSRQVDLMAATVPSMSGSLAAPVYFSFTHLLSRVQVVAKRSESTTGIEEFSPRIYAVRLYGMPETGNLSINVADLSDKTMILDAWTGVDATTSDSPLAVIQSSAGLDVANDGTILFDVLTLPQHITQNYQLEVEYSTSSDGSNRQIVAISLTSLPVTTWKAGQQYRYTFSVSDDSRILFDIPTVNAWDEAIGGITIVD